jgi:hypothetical protein
LHECHCIGIGTPAAAQVPLHPGPEGGSLDIVFRYDRARCGDGHAGDRGPGHETRKILNYPAAALPDLSLTVHDMATARIFTTRFDQLADINAAWGAFLAGVDTPPTRTSVGVSVLPLGASVEMEFAFHSDVHP